MRPRLGSGSGPVASSAIAELRLDVRDQVAQERLEVRADDEEGVERVADRRRVHLGVEDVEVGAVEVAAGAREQVLPVGRVDQHLQADAERADAGAHDRLGRVDAVDQRARVPGDLARVVAREVAELEGAPERHLDRAGQHRQVEEQARLELGRLDLGVEVGPRAAEGAQGQAVEVFEELALPRVPDLRAGAADVGDGEQVERGQAPLAADGGREIGDHVGVGEVFLLGDARHRQVLGDQVLDQRRVLAGDAVVAAEAPRLAHAELRVVAAAALGDVVEEGGDVEHPRPVEGRGELRAERVLVRVLGDQEAAHVAQHHQDVLVDRVDVEQVVLHLADDAAEHPEVAAEHAGLVHQPEGVRLPAGGLQDLHEGRVVDRVAPELRVHQVARVVERAQRPRRQALRPDRLLVDQEGLEDRVRVALVEVVARHLEHAAALEELLRDRPHRRVLQAGDALLDVEHQDLVQLRHRLGRPVVAPHQPLGGALARRVER